MRKQRQSILGDLAIGVVLVATTVSLTSGCLSEPESMVTDPLPDTSTPDTSLPDAGADAASDVRNDMNAPDTGGDDAAQACGGCAENLVCVDDECVECGVNSDCATDACEPVSRTCVQCVSQTSCLQPGASRCGDNFACAGCEVDADCSHIAGAVVCEAGLCVECTAADDSPCAGNACNPRDNVCTATRFQTLGTCQPCETDFECAPDSLCVVMDFQGTERNGGNSGYCLPLYTGDACPLTTGGYASSRSLPSIDDATQRDFCAPNQDMTTCEAVLDWGKVCDTDDDCGVAGDGARCLVTNGDGSVGTRCTYPCTSAQDCPALTACGATEGYCGRP